MIKNVLDDKIVVYKNIADDPMLIIKEASSISDKFNGLGFKAATINNHEYNTDLRSCTVFSLHNSLRDDSLFGNGAQQAKKALNAKINRSVFPAVLDYVKEYGFEIKNREAWELLSYEKTQKLTWHADHGDVHPCQISFVYYLNDDYEGGEIEFQNYIGKPYKPEAGDLIIFPSSPTYLHRVLPITNGTKYACISFGL